MKKIITLMTFLISLNSYALLNEGKEGHLEYQKRALKQKEKLEREGLIYMVGSGVGFATAVTLNILSDDPLAKMGYTFVQTVSGLAFLQGATYYTEGNSFVTDAEDLKDLEKILESKGMPTKQRFVILDNFRARSNFRRTERIANMQQIKGYLQITNAAACAASLLFSNGTGTSSTIALSFIGSVSLIGGLNDLIFNKTLLDENNSDSSLKPNSTLQLQLSPLSVGLSYRY